MADPGRDICRAQPVRHLAEAPASDRVVSERSRLCKGGRWMTTHGHLYPAQPLLRRAAAVRLSPSTRYAAGLLALAAAYYGSAKIGQTLRYTASVAAIWPPAGLGIAVLYLRGLSWWPGVFLGELAINGELLVGDKALPLGSLIGQQAGNLAEIVVGALL